MQMSLGLILNVIVGFSVVDGRWRGREAILDLDFTISHRCKCQFCQKRFSWRVLALRRVCKQMTIVAMRPCCKTGAKVVLRRSTTLSCRLQDFYLYRVEMLIVLQTISTVCCRIWSGCTTPPSWFGCCKVTSWVLYLNCFDPAHPNNNITTAEFAVINIGLVSK